MSREQKLELLIGLIVEHNNGNCSCDKECKEFMCLAMRFLTGNITLEEALSEIE
jgi:hypothetical protein